MFSVELEFKKPFNHVLSTSKIKYNRSGGVANERKEGAQEARRSVPSVQACYHLYSGLSLNRVNAK